MAIQAAAADHDLEPVQHAPVLDDPTLHDAGDVDDGELDGLTARRPEERARVGARPARPHPRHRSGNSN